MREIERKSGFSIGTVQRELKKLLELDLIIKREDGNRVYFEANKENPLYQDICNVTQKTVGLIHILKKSLIKTKEIEFKYLNKSSIICPRASIILVCSLWCNFRA